MPNANRDDEDRLYDLRDIKPFPENYRHHPKVQIDLIRKGLRQFSQYRNLVFWRDPADGQLYSLVGHAVIEAALQEGWTQIRARERSDLTRAEARALVAYNNQSALLAVDDQDDLSQLIASIHADDAKLAELAASGQEELQRLLKLAGQEPMAAPEAEMDKAAELQEKWQVKTGDLFQMGQHRLICGDCTDAAVVARVMQGEKANMVFADPPYGQGFDIAGDTREEYRDIYSNSLKNIISFCGENIYICCNFACIGFFLEEAERCGLQIYEKIVWVKNLFGQGRLYHRQHEDIVFMGHGDYRKDKRNEDIDVWNINSMRDFAGNETAKEDMGHPTQKPIAIPERAIKNSSIIGEIVLDPFLGSGTTLVACERLGRRGRGIEVHPPYVSVCLERLSQMGLEPRRIG